MGLLAVFSLAPTPGVGHSRCDVANHCLTSGVDMDVLNAHGLLAAATYLCQRLHLSREGSQELDCQVAIRVELRNLFGPMSATEQSHRRHMRCGHLSGKHRLDLVLWANAVDAQS